MGYFVKSVIGAAVFLGCLVLFNVKLVSLLETGTCASGNVPYEIAPGYQCPDNTGTDILLLTGSIFGMLIGAGIFAFRGTSPRGGSSRFGGMFGAGTFAWGLFFTATGATSLIASLTNEAVKSSNGGELGGIIVGATFLVMGVPALLIALWGLVKSLGGRDERPAAATAAAAGGGGVMSRMSSGLQQAQAAQQLSSRLPWTGAGGAGAVGSGGGTGGQIAKLERLQKLREQGALTDTEFEREKAKILAE
jgi:hypothetical protein